MSYLIGINGVAREVKDMFVGVNGVARRVTAGYIGLNGKSRLFFGGMYQPTVGEVIVNLTKEHTFADDTVFVKGRYKVEIAGAVYSGFSSSNKFTQETVMTEPFKIVACCSDPDGAIALGITSASGTIFGGRGGFSSGINISGDSHKMMFQQGSLCLGGCACHFMPRDGVFGTNYLRCFHVARGGDGTFGGGGAYGGGAGGRGSRTYTRIGSSGVYVNGTGGSGIAGAGGVGGTGGYGTINGGTGTGSAGNPGNSGSGIGYGSASNGGRAYFDGTSWSIGVGIISTTARDPYLKVTYLGPS